MIAAPALSSVDYAVVNTLGSSAITLTGTNLTNASGVTFGGTACTSVAVVNATTVTCVTPVKAAGTYDIVLTTPGGTATLTNGAEAWYPSQITGAYAVYDSEVGVTVSGANITGWADQSGGSHDLASVASTWPTYVATVFGSRHAVRFAATGLQQLRLAVHRAQTTGFSHFVIAKWTSSASYPSGHTGTYNAGLTLFSNYTSPAFNTWGASAGALDNIQFNGSDWDHDQRGSGLNDGAAHLIGVTHNQATGVIKQYVGAVQQGADATRTYSASNGWMNFGCGDGSDGFRGDVAFAVDVTGVISAGDLAKLNTWSQSSGFFT